MASFASTAIEIYIVFVRANLEAQFGPLQKYAAPCGLDMERPRLQTSAGVQQATKLAFSDHSCRFYYLLCHHCVEWLAVGESCSTERSLIACTRMIEMSGLVGFHGQMSHKNDGCE